MLALVALLGLSLIVGVIMTQVEVNANNSVAIAELRDKTFAADGGIEYTIQKMRQDSSICSSVTAAGWSDTVTLNGHSVDVSCDVRSGFATALSTWAAVATSPTGEFETQGGASTPKLINGPSYAVGDLELGADIEVTNGALLQASPPCSGTPTWTGGGTAEPGTIIVCTALPHPSIITTLPCLASCGAATPFNMVDRGPDPAYEIGTCRIFLPGKYTALTLPQNTHNYFASGVYYFENTGEIRVDRADVFGGKRSATDPQEAAPVVTQDTACATDVDAGINDGTGVEWILGGDSWVNIASSNSTSFELYRRIPANSPNGDEGTPGISIRTVPNPAPPGYITTAISGSYIFDSGGGSNPQVVVHGTIYTPEFPVALRKTNASEAVALSGVWGSSLLLEASASASPGPLASVQTSPAHRFIVVTATAYGNGASKDITTTAVIELRDDATHSVVVDSWVTNQT